MMLRAKTFDPKVTKVMMKVRYVRDLMYAIEFDEIIAKCIKMNFIKGSEVNNLKIEILN